MKTREPVHTRVRQLRDKGAAQVDPARAVAHGDIVGVFAVDHHAEHLVAPGLGEAQVGHVDRLGRVLVLDETSGVDVLAGLGRRVFVLILAGSAALGFTLRGAFGGHTAVCAVARRAIGADVIWHAFGHAWLRLHAHVVGIGRFGAESDGHDGPQSRKGRALRPMSSLCAPAAGRAVGRNLMRQPMACAMIGHEDRNLQCQRNHDAAAESA